MYEIYYGLSRKPFSILPDPSFLYFSRPHRMAFSMLEYGIINQAGFTAVTGEIGSGKTTLVRHLLSSASDSLIIGMITCPIRQRSRFLKWVMMAFRQPFEGISYVGLYKRFQDFIAHVRTDGRRAVLVIDEAQNLGPDELEELRMLSNINEEEQVFQLVLVGQPELNETLSLPEMLQFSQRISSDFFLRPLTLEDTSGYIEHRLHVAGGAPALFAEDAKAEIFQASGGIPRVINILSDMSLVYGYASGAQSITADIVRGVIDDRRSYGIFAQQMRSLKSHDRANGPKKDHVGSPEFRATLRQPAAYGRR